MCRSTLILCLLLSPLFLIAQDNDALILEFAREEIRQGKAEEAIKELQLGILKNDKERPAYLLAQSLCFWHLEQISKAKANLERVFETEKTNSPLINYDGYWLKGSIHEFNGEPDEEIVAYKKALSYNASHPEISVTLALALIENKKNEEGLEILNRMLAEGFEHSFIYNNKASALLNLDRLDEAKDALEKALELDAENPFVYYNYYQYYKKKGDLIKACENISIATQKNVLDYGLNNDLLFFQSIQKKECPND